MTLSAPVSLFRYTSITEMLDKGSTLQKQDRTAEWSVVAGFVILVSIAAFRASISTAAEVAFTLLTLIGSVIVSMKLARVLTDALALGSILRALTSNFTGVAAWGYAVLCVMIASSAIFLIPERSRLLVIGLPFLFAVLVTGIGLVVRSLNKDV